MSIHFAVCNLFSGYLTSWLVALGYSITDYWFIIITNYSKGKRPVICALSFIVWKVTFQNFVNGEIVVLFTRSPGNHASVDWGIPNEDHACSVLSSCLVGLGITSLQAWPRRKWLSFFDSSAPRATYELHSLHKIDRLYKRAHEIYKYFDYWQWWYKAFFVSFYVFFYYLFLIVYFTFATLNSLYDFILVLYLSDLYYLSTILFFIVYFGIFPYIFYHWSFFFSEYYYQSFLSHIFSCAINSNFFVIIFLLIEDFVYNFLYWNARHVLNLRWCHVTFT